MTTLLTTPTEITTGEDGWSPDEAQLAAAAFLARYGGRTLEAYRYDLRSFFQWAVSPRDRPCIRTFGDTLAAENPEPADPNAIARATEEWLLLRNQLLGSSASAHPEGSSAPGRRDHPPPG